MGNVALHGSTVWILAYAESREEVELANVWDSGNEGEVRSGFESHRRNLHRIPTLNGRLEVWRSVLGHVVLEPLPLRRPLNEIAISELVRDVSTSATPHRFGLSCRDWVAECFDAPREVWELALRH